jgi:protoheme IX farnesyltransferase
MYKSISVYADLIKYKLSFAVVLSSVTGYFLYSNTVNYHLFFLATGILLLSSGSAALNQYTEKRADSIMDRTKERPIPSKRISEKKALRIASFLLFTGCIFLYFNGITPFLLGIFSVLLYNPVYTHLKKLTVLSIIPGALVGALPPAIGFTSAGGSLLHQNNIAFSVFMFLWQLPHFWLIILKYGKEYKAAGFATISKYLSNSQIRYLVFFWVLSSTGFLFLFFILSDTLDKKMFIFLSIVNLIFISLFYRLLFLKREPLEIRGAFILINSFTFFLMLLLIAASILKST